MMMDTSSGKGCGVCQVAWILMVIGGLNWGLVGLGGFLGSDLNVVHMLLGSWPMVEWIVYVLVGLAAVVKGFNLCKCMKGSC
jgi:hypothetical protein